MVAAIRAGLAGLLWAIGFVLSLPGAGVLWLAEAVERRRPAVPPLPVPVGCRCQELPEGDRPCVSCRYPSQPPPDLWRPHGIDKVPPPRFEPIGLGFYARQRVVPIDPAARLQASMHQAITEREARALRLVPKDRTEHP